MKRTRLIDAFSTIKKNRISFIAIVVFVALGIATFSGIGMMSSLIYNSVENTYKNTNYHDIEIQCPFGLSKEQVDKIEKLEDVSEVDGTKIQYRIFSLNNVSHQARVFKLTKKLDKVFQIEGRLPQKKGEIAVRKYFAKENNIKLGDKITFKANDKFSYKKATYTVTALCESPSVFLHSKTCHGVSEYDGSPVSLAMYVADEGFLDKSNGAYNTLYIRCDALRAYNTSDALYLKKANEIKDRLCKRIKKIIAEDRKKLNVDSFFDRITAQVTDYYSNVSKALASVRNDGYSYMSVKVLGETILNLRFSLGGLFFIVGLLVCFTVITRIITDDEGKIGVKRALGYKRREVLYNYLFFSFLAVVIGCLIATILTKLVLYFAKMRFTDVYTFQIDTSYAFDIKGFALICLVEIVLILSSAFLACVGSLRKNVVTLISDTKEIKGKKRFFEKFGIWKNRSLLFKTTINNIFNDKKRVVCTLVGIIGSTMLIVTSFTYKENIVDGYTKQFDKFYKFDSIITFDADDEKQKESIQKLLDKYGIENEGVYFSFMKMNTKGEGKRLVRNVIYDDTDTFRKFFKFETIDGKKVADNNGFWVFSAYSNFNNADEKIKFTSLEGKEANVNPTGYFKYYLSVPQVYISRNEYEKLFGTKPKNNSFIISTNGVDVNALNAELQKLPGTILFDDYKKSAYSDFEIFLGVAIGIMVEYIGLSIVLAFFVLLNLYTMFVEEKKKELLVLRVNGYGISKMKQYIYVDTIILNVVGIFVGCVLGEIMGNAVVYSIETQLLEFVRKWVYSAFVIGIVFAFVLSFIMICFAMRKIKKYRIVDLNR